MRKKSKQSMQIIGGADGPVSIFVAGKKDTPRNLVQYWCSVFWRKKQQRKRKKVLKWLKPMPHSLEEVATYITERYHAVEYDLREAYDLSELQIREQYCGIKAALVREHAPELLGEPPQGIDSSDLENEEAIQKYLAECEAYQERAMAVSEEQFPMNYHHYRITLEECGVIDVGIEYVNGFLEAAWTTINCNRRKNTKSKLDRVCKDIYLYYGVTKDDIEKNTERMKSLMAVLTID